MRAEQKSRPGTLSPVPYSPMENSIEIIRPGSTVMIGEHFQRKARVSQATVTETGFVLYEVIWWDGDTRNNMWIGHNEVESVDRAVMRVNLVIQ